MDTKKILCPVDFSDSSRGALELALRLAREARGSVTLAHVVQTIYVTSPDPGFGLAPVYTAMFEGADQALAALKAEAARLAPTVPVEVVRELGTPWDHLTGLARRGKFDLVVMGTHGRTGLAHVLVGSVAERVVRHAPCPVLVTRAPVAEPFRSILCPVDFSEPSRLALRGAAELAGKEGASLTILHVYARRPASSDKELEAEVARIRPVIGEWEIDARVWGAPSVEVAWEEGTPWQAIVRRAAAGTHDLIAVGTHGRTGIQHVLLGSVAERVIRHAPCSVLAVRAIAR
jgi:nucleotide-binding universal stress UspA family protein